MGDKPRITLLVLDLDDTLWTWFDAWHKSFEPFISSLAKVTGVPVEKLKAETKVINQLHGTSEYSFLLEELPSLRELYGNFDSAVKFADLIAEYQRNRDEATKLYPDVLPTLRKIRATGCRVVGYTESLAFYASQRIRKLELDGVLEVVYSPADHDIPAHLSTEQVRRFSPDKYTLKGTLHRTTAAGVLKPDTRVLASIIRDFSVPLTEVAYVGDSLAKDMQMAKSMSVSAVHAKYGEAHGDIRYQLLVEVSHWTDAMVAAQTTLTQSDVRPDVVLDGSLKQILDYFDFDGPEPESRERQEQVMEAWKQTVSTQEHFNDLQLRLRTFMITLLVAVLGATGFALKDHVALPIYGIPISAAVIICFAGLVGVFAFFYMDYGYHHLLIGAVKHGLAIEHSSRQRLPCIQLAHSISRESPTPPLWCLFLRTTWYEKLLAWNPRGFQWFLAKHRSITRMKLFYVLALLLMVATGAFVQVVGVSGQGAVPPAAATQISASSAMSYGDAALRKYYSSGAYTTNMDAVINDAVMRLDKSIAAHSDPRKPAIVLDIDDTALSTWTILDKGSFGWDSKRYEDYVASAALPPIEATLRLYRHAHAAGIACFFVTSRFERLREATEKNLKAVGFQDFIKVYMKPDGSSESTPTLKAHARQAIEDSGYRVILNIGDQMDDLWGGFAESHVLFPNPFYTAH